MYDVLPFPNIVASTTEELTSQINNYLIQFKESLEFALMNISTDNLSPDLIERLNTLGADIEKSIEERDDQIKQVANKTLSVSDVINSPAFSAAIDSEMDEIMTKIKFTVNFETGNLEYTTS